MNTLLAKSKKMNNKKGFTLIELIVVIVIIGILAAIVVPKLSGFSSTAEKAACEADARTILTAITAYVAENGTTNTPTEDQVKELSGDYDGDLKINGVDPVSFTYDLGDWRATVTDGSNISVGEKPATSGSN